MDDEIPEWMTPQVALILTAMSLYAALLALHCMNEVVPQIKELFGQEGRHIEVN